MRRSFKPRRPKPMHAVTPVVTPSRKSCQNRITDQHREQPQRSERIHHCQIREPNQHNQPSSPTHANGTPKIA